MKRLFAKNNLIAVLIALTLAFMTMGCDLPLLEPQNPDNSAYCVANGNFDNGLEGWTLTLTIGNDTFAGIDDKTTFGENGYAMNNVGNYFSGYADFAKEGSQGTLASSYFEAKGDFATYMLGGAGNPQVYITIENQAGEVLALYRNTKFADFPEGEFSVEEKRAMIGNTVFLANFVTYKVNISAFAGQQIRFVVHDHASAGWGVVFFDELNTYYATNEEVPANAVLAQNLLANKDALNTELALEVTEQGDFTTDSFNVYRGKLSIVKELASDIASTQEQIDLATTALTEARLALALRPVEEVADANKAFGMIAGSNKEIAIADYVNDNALSNITYAIQSNNALLTLSDIQNGAFVISAGDFSEDTTAIVSIIVSYNGEQKLVVELTVQISVEVAPVLVNQSVAKEYDVYSLDNKENIVINFAENVNNAGNLELAYSVQHAGEQLVLDGTNYTFVLATYGEVATQETFNVTVSYVANGKQGTIEYTYTLSIKDTSLYRVVNSGFDKGLDGWILTNTHEDGGPFAGIDTKTTFWAEEFAMNNVGNYFSSYADGAREPSHGNLASSYFIVNSEYATFMLGGAGNPRVYITLEKESGEVIALFRNTKFADLPAGDYSVEEKREMIGKTVFLANFVTYKVSLDGLMGEKVRFVIHDYASAGWGVVFFDELNTYYPSNDLIPENAILAENLLVNKDALNAEIALEVTEQGDFTADSFNAYVEKLAIAKALANDIGATHEEVNGATTALTEARLALALRPVEEVADANKAFKLYSGNVKEIVLTDYINTNGLSSITYEIQADSQAVVLSLIEDGKFTVTACDVNEITPVIVSISVLYKGEQKLVVELAVQVTNDLAPTLFNEEIVNAYDIFDLENKENIQIDFAENINNEGNLVLAYSVQHAGEQLVLDGTCYTFAFGSYNDIVTNEIFTVTVSYTANGKQGSIEYTYTLAMKNTTAYRVVNGSFDKGLDGWTLTNTFGEKPFGGIDNKTTFWGEGFAMNNAGDYFSAYAEGAEEYSHGNLASSYFVANSAYATYMLGGAGNHRVYITIENAEGAVLALYRNTKFTDFPAGEFSVEEKRAMIGNNVFLANFVTFKVDISAFAGQEIRFVIHDYASAGWGVVFFDELNTYYASNDLVPEYAILAENLLANKDALNEELALEITEQGDFTADSFNAYVEKVAQAKEIAGDIAATQEMVNGATTALTEARLALALRSVEEVAGANKSFRLTSGNDKEIVLADYINTNGLSNITYNVQASDALITASSIVDGKFTITAGTVSQETIVTVSISVLYNGERKLVVELSVQITNDLAPTLFNEEVVKEYDIYLLDNKAEIVLDFAENVDNEGGLALTYSAKYFGEEIVLNGSVYTFAFGTYTDAITNEIFTVTVSYTANGSQASIEYTFTLSVKDTTSCRLVNGGFEDGLDGWVKVGNIGNVSNDTHYWVEEWENNGKGYEFGMDGASMFSAYAPGSAESAVGTLTSSTFKVGGSGFITFKIGAMKDGNYVYVDVVDAETKQILVRYYNGLWAENTDGLKSGCSLIAYKADLSAFIGKQVFFRISDNADSGYGLFFADSFVTYYETEPENFNQATTVGYAVSGTIYDVFNGGFEMGDVQGWWNNGEPGKVTSANAFFSGVEYGKVGEFLYSGVEDFQAGNGREGLRGVLTSSTFEIGGTGYVSYMYGGGGNALCYVQVIDATTGEILARYRQQAMQDAVLIQYVADLKAYIGRTVRFQVVDQAENAWGCVSFDNLITYYASVDALPAGIVAEDIKGNIKYDIENGSFETGNIDGWSMHISEAGAHNTLGWVSDVEIDAGWYAKNDGIKDGNFLFTFALTDGTNCENTKGALQSSTFSLKQGAFVSFKFGGAGGGSNHGVFIELCRADGSVIARFFNDAEGKVNTRMNSYYYQYHGVEVECFFRVVDDSTGDYGCFVVDDFRVNLENAPEGYIPAIQ